MTSLDLETLRRIAASGRGEPPEAEELARWAAGELADDDLDELLLRIAASPAGVELWRVAAAVRAGSQELEAAGAPAARSARRTFVRTLPVAATVVLAVLCGLLWRETGTTIRILESENAVLSSRLASLREATPPPASPAQPAAVELSRTGTIVLDRERGERRTVARVGLDLVAEPDPVPLVLSVAGSTSAHELVLALVGSGDEPTWSHTVAIPEAVAREPAIDLVVRIPKAAWTEPVMHLAVLRRQPRQELFQVDFALAAGAHPE